MGVEHLVSFTRSNAGSLTGLLLWLLLRRLYQNGLGLLLHRRSTLVISCKAPLPYRVGDGIDAANLVELAPRIHPAPARQRLLG